MAGGRLTYDSHLRGFNFNGIYDLQRTFPAGQELYGISFQYHMYGATMGSAVLESSSDSTSWVSLWSKLGNQGDQWLQATMYGTSGQTMLRFVYTYVASNYGAWARAINDRHCYSLPLPPRFQVHVRTRRLW